MQHRELEGKKKKSPLTTADSPSNQGVRNLSSSMFYRLIQNRKIVTLLISLGSGPQDQICYTYTFLLIIKGLVLDTSVQERYR